MSMPAMMMSVMTEAVGMRGLVRATMIVIMVVMMFVAVAMRVEGHRATHCTR
jgi:putative exporter of polyketide antibiotics